MTPITFRGYGAGSKEQTIIAERILCWCLIDHNGNHGTRITLDTGKEINVGHWPGDVEKMVRAARMAAQEAGKQEGAAAAGARGEEG